MAHTELNAANSSLHIDFLSLANAAFKDAVRQFASSGSKMRQFDALTTLSDAELEERGLKRSMLGKFVFADNIWT